MAKASSRKMRKSTRRSGRKGSRRAASRRMNRRASRRCWSGGAPASVDDTSMNASSKLSLAQGGDYMAIHAKQHGGMAPVGYTGVLDDSLRATARVAVLDESMGAIQGMSDQAGGGRRRKGKKAKKGKKFTHKNIMAMLKKLNKRQRGGSAYALTQAQDYSAPGMLLSPSAEARALGGMNPEWKLASDPTSFVPNRI